jgi:fibronectin type 3 domain-containing protein
VYRALGDGPFEKLADTQEAPSYSDRAAQSGKSYRYAIAAFDKLGNESEKSSLVTVIAQ